MTRKQYYVALVVLAVTGLAGGILGSWLFVGRAPSGQHASVITARELCIVDDKGNVRIRVGPDKALLKKVNLYRPGVSILDIDGEARADLSVSSSGDGILTLDAGLADSSEYHAVIYADSWKSLEFMAANNCEKALTDRLTQISCIGDYSTLGRDRISGMWFVDTKTQPGWRVYRDNGHFSCSDREIKAAYEKAAYRILDNLRIDSFTKEGELRSLPQHYSIVFFIHGYPVGTWRDGKMILEGEE